MGDAMEESGDSLLRFPLMEPFFVVKFLVEKRVVTLDKLVLLAVLRINLFFCILVELLLWYYKTLLIFFTQVNLDGIELISLAVCAGLTICISLAFSTVY